MQLEHFQMIDRVETIDLGAQRIVCTAVVPDRSSILDHHFPGNPILPGVFMIETMAQASGYLVLAGNRFSRMPFLSQVEKAKLRKFVEPGTVMTADAQLEHEGSGYAVTKARLSVDGKGIADAELRFRTVPFETPDQRGLLLDAAAAVGLEGPAAAGEAPLDA